MKLEKPVKNADSYLEISFDEEAGNFNSSDTLTLNTAINNKYWFNVNSDDDYSL